MVDVTLLTSTEYRKNYPGRALVDIDNVRSTTFPALPITADGDMFANLIDLHQKDKNSPIYVNPYYNDSNGTLVLNETVFMQNKIDSRPLDMIMWDFQGEVTFGRFPTDRTFTRRRLRREGPTQYKIRRRRSRAKLYSGHEQSQPRAHTSRRGRLLR